MLNYRLSRTLLYLFYLATLLFLWRSNVLALPPSSPGGIISA
ncbi:hypothetical protein B194_1698 [Serratia plymuthica A30]|nr:hypothetical protein B194_1698 [Serratia plymuthica A30]